jgi:hypothetical protein
LVEERLTVHEDQGIPRPLGDQVDASDRLADPRRRHQDPEVVGEHRLDGGVLNVGESALEGVVDGGAVLSLVVGLERRAERTEQGRDLVNAAPRNRHVLREVFGAGDHPWRQRRREPHALLLVELGILERGNALERIQNR